MTVDQLLFQVHYHPDIPVKHRRRHRHRDAGTARVLRCTDLYAAAGKWVHRRRHTSHRADTVRVDPDLLHKDRRHGGQPGQGCALVTALAATALYLAIHLAVWMLP